MCTFIDKRKKRKNALLVKEERWHNSQKEGEYATWIQTNCTKAYTSLIRYKILHKKNWEVVHSDRFHNAVWATFFLSMNISSKLGRRNLLDWICP